MKNKRAGMSSPYRKSVAFGEHLEDSPSVTRLVEEVEHG